MIYGIGIWLQFDGVLAKKHFLVSFLTVDVVFWGHHRPNFRDAA